MTTHIHDAIGGGRFLAQSVSTDDVFTREELTEEQRLFGQTAAEFMRHEVVPREAELYAHEWALTRQLLRKAADLDLTRLEIPAAYGGLGLDKISAAYVGEQIAINPSFAGSLGAHTSIGTLPLVYFGTDEQKAKYLPRSPTAPSPISSRSSPRWTASGSRRSSSSVAWASRAAPTRRSSASTARQRRG